MDDLAIFETLNRTDMPYELQTRVFTAIADIFTRAIDAHSPTRRPPGKAGLRAEKGYYRLLYLEGEYRQHVAPDPRDGDTEPHNWHRLTPILNQLQDLPELKQQLIADIESTLNTILPSGSSR